MGRSDIHVFLAHVDTCKLRFTAAGIIVIVNGDDAVLRWYSMAELQPPPHDCAGNKIACSGSTLLSHVFKLLRVTSLVFLMVIQ